MVAGLIEINANTASQLELNLELGKNAGTADAGDRGMVGVLC